ncbi:unnamed protein product [Blepharisma stoltei]|uniref:EamA domain-containing protein n=1 Tax=Blepharisma stoltei TaxID=1481888 RepID=A0AAU9J5Y4_9CILI|nr:unnamed protein product [Blepharisma stoltei]
MSNPSNILIYIFMILMLISGTANTLTAKAMDIVHSEGAKFEHPYFQTASMFFGEVLCLLIYYTMQRINKRKISIDSKPILGSPPPAPRTGLYKKLGPFIFVIPAFFDLLGSTFIFIGLILSAASVYQMIRGFIIVIVCIYSIIFLKRRLFRHETTGVIMITLGIAITGIASIVNKANTAEDPVLGVIVLFIGELLLGGMYVSEELLLKNVNVDPLQAVGIEGLCGSCMYLLILPILYAIPCNEPKMCDDGRVEDSIQALKQIGASWQLMFLWWGTMTSIASFNFSGISTTKHVSSLARSTIGASRTFFVWIFSMILEWENFLWLQLIGFVLLVFGTLLYNEVLVLPWFGFKEAVGKHRTALLEKRTKDGTDEDAIEIVGDFKLGMQFSACTL